MSSEEIFFMDIKKSLTLFMVKKGIKSNLTLFCHLITDPFPSYIFINFLFTSELGSCFKFTDFMY